MGKAGIKAREGPQMPTRRVETVGFAAAHLAVGHREQKMISSILSAVVIGLIGGFAIIVVGTINRKGKMGINTSKVSCPKCGNPMPAIRTPKNIRQFLWGGSTCVTCGCETDKWGKVV